MIPHRTPFFLPLLYPSLTWRIPTEEREIYLTFDDGPMPGLTEFVLEELSKASIQATFFCIGDNIRKHPGVFQKIVQGGHAYGNHTYNHINGWSTNTASYIENVKKADEMFSSSQNSRTNLFRPPYGRITYSQIKALTQYRIVMWDVLSLDYDRNISKEKCLRNTLKAVRPGSIIVFHDSHKAERNLMYTLPRLIDQLLENEFVFKPLSFQG